LPQQSRRKFLYAGAGIAAVAGISYLTRDYSYPIIQEEYKELYRHLFPEASPTITPTGTVATETSTPIPTQSPTSTVTPTATPTGQMSEDEIMIRQLMVAWRDLYSTGNVRNAGSVYADDARLDFGCTGMFGSTRFNGPGMISSLIASLHSTEEGKITGQRIIELRIQGNEAYVVSHEDMIFRPGPVAWVSKFKLIKISEIKRGASTFKLSKPLWKIQDEYSHCAGDG